MRVMRAAWAGSRACEKSLKIHLHGRFRPVNHRWPRASVASATRKGALAQLVEHLHGMQGVSGSNPLRSTFPQSIDYQGFAEISGGLKASLSPILCPRIFRGGVFHHDDEACFGTVWRVDQGGRVSVGRSWARCRRGRWRGGGRGAAWVPWGLLGKGAECRGKKCAVPIKYQQNHIAT